MAAYCHIYESLGLQNVAGVIIKQDILYLSSFSIAARVTDVDIV